MSSGTPASITTSARLHSAIVYAHCQLRRSREPGGSSGTECVRASCPCRGAVVCTGSRMCCSRTGPGPRTKDQRAWQTLAQVGRGSADRR